MSSVRMTTPVRPTPALQCTTTGGLRLFEVSSIELVCLLTDWISSRYAAEKKSHIDDMSSLYAGSVLTHIWLRIFIIKDGAVALTEKSQYIFRTALLRPICVLQVPDRPLLARQQVFNLQPRSGVAPRVRAKFGGHLELAVSGWVVFGAQFRPIAVTLGPAALLDERTTSARWEVIRGWWERRKEADEAK